MMMWLNACPVCSVPVTLGGGSWMLNDGRAASSLGACSVLACHFGRPHPLQRRRNAGPACSGFVTATWRTTNPLEVDTVQAASDDLASAQQFMLTLTRPGPDGRKWRARVLLPDNTVREFSSPFELMRFLSWPLMPERRRSHGGLR